MEKVIVYGLGQRWMESQKYIESNYEIIGYSDANIAKRMNYKNKFINKEDIGKYLFDFIIVTSYLNILEIRKELCSILSIDEKKVKSIYEILCDEYCPEYKGKRNTSITDAGLWPSFCMIAANNLNIFNTFRSNPVTLFTCEHFEEQWDKKMIETIEREYGIVFSDEEWELFLENDRVGGAIKKSYRFNNIVRKANCTTIRYVRILQQLCKLYNNMLRVEKIVEIGGGYGGQCRIIMQYCPIKEYAIIDLPEVLELVKQYLRQFSIKDKNVRYIDGTSVFKEEEYDLVISNYAFSELQRNVQEMYINKIISHSKKGFIIWNNLSWKRLGGYSLEEVLACINGSKIIPEDPQTGVENCIIVWGMKEE